MKKINDDDTEFVPGTPPTQSSQPTPPSSKGNKPKSKVKPLNVKDLSELNYVELALKQKEYQQNNFIKKQTTDNGLSRPSITNITEQINNFIENGRAKEDRKDTMNKRLNDSNISKTRREYYK
jgi:hypothetical protein